MADRPPGDEWLPIDDIDADDIDADDIDADDIDADDIDADDIDADDIDADDIATDDIDADDIDSDDVDLRESDFPIHDYYETALPPISDVDDDARYFKPLHQDIAPIFEVTDASILALWSWPTATDSCAICHESLLHPCIGCSANSIGSANCKLTWSSCSHGYHTHCISKWILKRDSCPLCNAPWAVEAISGE